MSESNEIRHNDRGPKGLRLRDVLLTTDAYLDGPLKFYCRRPIADLYFFYGNFYNVSMPTHGGVIK